MSKPSFASTAVRKPEEILAVAPQFTKEVRAKLETKEKLALVKEATAGSIEKLDTLDSLQDIMSKAKDSFLTNNVEVETFIEHLEQHCIRFDMNYFMTNFPVLEPAESDKSDRFRSNKTVNLFKKWDMIGNKKSSSKKDVLKRIGEAIAWLKTYTEAASEAYLEDMDLIHRHLMNSMSPRLRDTVQSTMKHDFPPAQHGGPLTFAIMIDKVINLSSAAIETLKNTIRNYDIKSVPGEDISVIVRRFLYAFKRLESNQATDDIFVSKLYDVFQTSSVNEFNEQIAHMKRSSKGTRGVHRTYKEILDEAEEHFDSIRADGKWIGVTPLEQESVFIGDHGQAVQDKVGAPPTTSPYSAPTAEDLVSSNPPCYQRVIKGRTLKYCAKCTRFKGSQKKGRWNPSHFTDEHHGGNPRAPTPPPSRPATGNANSERQVSFADALMAQHAPPADA